MTDDTKPTPTETFVAKATDLQALRDAAVDAANVSSGLWLSYLFVFFYLAIAAGSVTHRDLLFENPVKLPFLNIDLPLVGFFVLGPLLFLIVHAYVLLHFVLLAGKIGDFHTALDQIEDQDANARLRRQLPSNIFVQFLAGPPEVRMGLTGFILRLIAWISLAAGPLALLVFFQLQFLPYHHEAITWWQRLAVVGDLVLLWALWPSIARGERRSQIRWRDLRQGKIAAAATVSLVLLLLVFAIATFPGERLDRNPITARFVPTWDANDGTFRWTSPHVFLVAGDVDFVTRRPRSLWSNVLVAPGVTLRDQPKFDTDAKIKEAAVTVSLRGRHLEKAVLIGTELPKAVFTAAHLEGARLDDAELQAAKFPCEPVPPNVETGRCANLQGASLTGAKLQGAFLEQARLQGASLLDAQLQGAFLRQAELAGASLHSAQLRGAVLDGANLQGAILSYANLQGASLAGAKLEGALLSVVDMQGADFRLANMEGALIDAAFVWRADPRGASGNPIVISPVVEAKARRSDCPSICDWSASSFAALKNRIEANVADSDRRADALRRIARLDPQVQIPEEGEVAEAWVNLAKSQPPGGLHESRRDAAWREAACRGSDAPYVAAGLLRNLDDLYLVAYALPAALAVVFLDTSACPGARGLSTELKEKLQWILDHQPPSGSPATPPVPR